MINKYKINTGASVKDYNKVSDWLSFEIPNKIFSHKKIKFNV